MVQSYRSLFCIAYTVVNVNFADEDFDNEDAEYLNLRVLISESFTILLCCTIVTAVCMVWFCA